MFKLIITIVTLVIISGCSSHTTYYPCDGVNPLKERVKSHSEGFIFSDGDGKTLDMKLVELNGVGI